MAYTLPPIASVAEGNGKLVKLLKSKIDHKLKPVGALGTLEDLALQMGLIQRSDVVSLQQPQMVVFAADHGVAQSGVSAYPQEMTTQMVHNVLHGGAAVNVFARQHGFALTVVDAGVASDLPAHARLIDCKVARGTINIALAPAMSKLQCNSALTLGADIVKTLPGNVMAFGDIGVGNTTSAAMLLTRLAGTSIAEATGRGTGISDEQLVMKRSILLNASLKYRTVRKPLDVLTHFGGFEIAMMVSAMLQAAHERRIILVDGFVAGTAALVAKALAPQVTGYMVFSHQSAENGHSHLLASMGAQPLLQLGLHLGEGVGALLAWPLVASAAKFLNEMASFESAGMSKRKAAPDGDS